MATRHEKSDTSVSTTGPPPPGTSVDAKDSQRARTHATSRTMGCVSAHIAKDVAPGGGSERGAAPGSGTNISASSDAPVGRNASPGPGAEGSVSSDTSCRIAERRRRRA